MSFQTLQIRYQTARSLPAPYAYFYTLTARPIQAGPVQAGPAGQDVQIELAITYPDRDDIDDDELIAEGYTRDDDFRWSGRLPQTWQRALADQVAKTRLTPFREDDLGEDDDFWAVHVEADGRQQVGRPSNPDDWQYLMQELIQASYEASGRERPFELTYLNIGGRLGDEELNVSASFRARTVEIKRARSGRSQSQTLPWSELQRIMGEVYSVDHDAEQAESKRPRRAGHWLNIGGDEWYDISDQTALVRLFDRL